MDRNIVAPRCNRAVKPKVYAGTSVPMKAKTIVKNGIFFGLYIRPPWRDQEHNCDCGRGPSLPQMHARWCDVQGAT